MWKLIPLAAMMAVAIVAFTSGSSPPASAGMPPLGDVYGVDVNIYDDPAGHAEFIGMPEARIILAQAATYIACAPKSNGGWHNWRATRPRRSTTS